ncbi:MAG: hypothetical protein MJ195_02440 [Mycoplasmoidaceae bacterium]|nr:hypothetical protein [Mycoplasmoidaceae bacterium]
MKLSKLLSLLVVVPISATLPITACTSESSPEPEPEVGKEFNFDSSNYETLSPWEPEKGEESYTHETCLAEYISRVTKDVFEDDFLGD